MHYVTACILKAENKNVFLKSEIKPERDRVIQLKHKMIYCSLFLSPYCDVFIVVQVGVLATFFQ